MKSNFAWSDIQKHLKLIKYKFWMRPKKTGRSAWLVLKILGFGPFCRQVLKRFFYLPPLYEIYLDLNTIGPSETSRFRRNQQNFKHRPVISMLLHVSEWKTTRIARSITSVLNQVWPNVELLITTPTTLVAKLEKYIQAEIMENSITICPISDQLPKADRLNMCLNKIRGEYFSTMDSGDELAPHCLYEVVSALQNEQYDLLYTDEDKIDDHRIRQDPFFKPDWSPDFLHSLNYIQRLAVFRCEFILNLGGYSSKYQNVTEYDLLLRTGEKTKRIKHIPGILYHQNLKNFSATLMVNTKICNKEDERRALEDSLLRDEIKGAVVEGIFSESWRVKRTLCSSPLISIIIPFRDNVDVLSVCLNSILEKTTYKNYELILVDNASILDETKGYLYSLRNNPHISVLSYDDPFNFSAINNFAVKRANGEMILLLNNDTEVITPEWLEAMLEHAQRPEVGAVGAKLYFPNGTIQHAGVVIGLGHGAGHAFAYQSKLDVGYFGQTDVVRNISAVTGACIMTRKEVYTECGGLDEKNFKVAYNDIDFCLRLREQDYLIVYTPYAQLFHHESYSRGKSVNRNEILFFRKKYTNILRNGDPYYNVNLTLDKKNYQIRI